MELRPPHHYVYGHRRADDGSVFYVGKGKQDRAWSAHSRNRWWRHVNHKHGRTVHIIKSELPEPCAQSLEMAIIQAIGLDRLTNVVMGGGGTTGWRHSDAAKQKISAFNKGKQLSPFAAEALRQANLGTTRSPEVRAKLSAAKKGRPRGPMPAHVRQKISASHTGMKASPETIEKLRLSHIGKNKGRASGSYDHAVRTFEHPSLGSFVGTRGDFIATYSLSDPCVSAVIHGRQKSVKGWRLA